MKYIISILMLIILSSLVSAAVLDDINELSNKYSGQKMPAAFSMLFGNERINIHLDDNKLNVVTEDGIITSFGQGHLDDPTMNVYVTEETVRKVLDSEDKQAAAKQALKEVDIKGVGAGKKTKLFFVKIGAKVASWFM